MDPISTATSAKARPGTRSGPARRAARDSLTRRGSSGRSARARPRAQPSGSLPQADPRALGGGVGLQAAVERREADAEAGGGGGTVLAGLAQGQPDGLLLG